MSAYYTDEMHGHHDHYDLGGFPLSTGYTLPEARLAY